MFMTLVWFIIILAVLVLIHEFGHFIAAKRSGVLVEEFGFGFPPRAIGWYKDPVTKRLVRVVGKGKNSLKETVGGGERVQEFPSTLYSINWLPLGGFVKIKGEDGHSQDPDSFAGKSAWIRTKVLGAGVAMNFIFAWLLISIVFTLGLPQPIDPSQRAQYPDAKIQILEVKKGTPAEMMGLQLGDEILTIAGNQIASLKQVSDTIAENKGKSLEIKIDRLGKEMVLTGIPRIDYPAGEGALGIHVQHLHYGDV